MNSITKDQGMMRMATQNQAQQTHQAQAQMVDQLIATCDDCCNQLRQCDGCDEPLKKCESLRNELQSAKNMHAAQATVGGGMSVIDWQNLMAKAFAILQAVIQILSQQQPSA